MAKEFRFLQVHRSRRKCTQNSVETQVSDPGKVEGFQFVDIGAKKFDKDGGEDV